VTIVLALLVAAGLGCTAAALRSLERRVQALERQSRDAATNRSPPADEPDNKPHAPPASASGELPLTLVFPLCGDHE
jgi:hypothetical protein